MGKIVTIYLTDDEARELKTFCDENQCTQYSALKTAVKQLLSKDKGSTSEIGMTQADDEPTEVERERKDERKPIVITLD